MTARLPIILAALGCTVLVAAAQSPRPYAGMQSRQIKALSDQDISDLKSARGMGLALAAELNGYPGPRHVLEFAEQLDLTPQQKGEVSRLFDRMKGEAIPLGEQLISQEAHLDRLFVERSITEETLGTATAEIGKTQAELRKTHLKYHLTTVALLTSAQMRRYAELRGYDSGAREPHRPDRVH